MGILRDNMPTIGLAIFAAIALCLILANFARPIATILNVLDHPDGARKLHQQATPLAGGLCILLPLGFWCFAVHGWFQSSDERFLRAVAICAGLAGLIGFADDRHNIRPWHRLIGLVFVLMIGFAVDPDLIAHQLNWGSFAPTNIAMWPYLALLALTATGLVNAVNMADGQNGVVLGLYVIWAACMALTTAHAVAAISMVLFVLSSVVLCFNLMGKLFLGDAGTYGVTFAFGLLATAIHARGYASLETIIVWFFIPVADCLRLMITRALKGASPMHGDRDHFHHRLNDKFGRDYGLAVYWAAVAIPSAIATLEPKFALVALVCLTAFYFSCTGVSEPLEPTTRLANREGGNTALLERAAIDGQ